MAAKATGARTFNYSRANSRLLIVIGLAILALAFFGRSVSLFGDIFQSPATVPVLIGTALISLALGIYPRVRAPKGASQVTRSAVR